MKATIHELVNAPQTDYVEAFQAFAALGMEIQRMGPTPERLMKKGILEIDLGAYVDAKQSIQDALLANASVPEGMYYLGVVNVYLSLQRAGVLAAAQGQFAPEYARVHMEEACVAFRSALAVNDDEDLRSQLAACEALLEDASDEPSFLQQFEG